MSAYYWTPIGYGEYDYGSANYIFSGNYDGGGYNISGLFIVDSLESQGLFGTITHDIDIDLKEVHIKNVNIVNSEIEGGRFVGAIVGFTYIGCTVYVENCHNYGNVRGSSSVGGIVGRGYSIVIDSCTNSGDIYCYSNSDQSGVGGIVGSLATSFSSITNCFNFGNITGKYSVTGGWGDPAGGIVGYGATNITKNCFNAGDVIGFYAGGIAGYVYNRDVEISECWNAGYVESPKAAGGIVGRLIDGSTTIKNCCNVGEIKDNGLYAYSGGIVGTSDLSGTPIAYCYNLGKVADAGICGYQACGNSVSSSRIYNCVNFGEATNGVVSKQENLTYYGIEPCKIYNSYVDEVLGIPVFSYSPNENEINCGTCTEEQAKSVEWYTNRDNWYSSAWDFENVWTIVPGVNDGFPILRNMASYITYVSNFGENETVTQNSPAGESVVIAGVDLFEREGYTISSWNTMADGSGDSFAPGFTFEGGVSLTLYAQWGRMAYTVTFDANGGSGTMSSVEKNYNEDLVLPANEFTKTGYNFKGWATSANGSVVYGDGAKYTANAGATLYAVWEAMVISVNLDVNGGSGGTSTIYLKYDSGWYSSSSCTSSSKITALPSTPTRTGYEFKGYSTEPDGSGTLAVSATGAINVSDTFYSTDGTRTWYAVWEARNPAYYDSDGGFWYVENGKLPQSKVSGSLKSTLSSSWGSLSNGDVYYMGVEELAENDLTSDGGMQSRVYNGEEYVKFNGEYYLVEPIRWRLVYSSSQKEGYAVENTSVLATMAEIVFVGSYSSAKIGVGAGYSAESVTMLLKNQVSDDYLVSESREVEIFGAPKDTTTVSGSVFVASMEELASFTTSENNTTGSGVKPGKVPLSDFVKDYLRATGQGDYYFTRDLGDQLNTIRCLNPVGDRSQAKAQQTLGVQFTIKVTEYACKSV